MTEHRTNPLLTVPDPDCPSFVFQICAGDLITLVVAQQQRCVLNVNSEMTDQLGGYVHKIGCLQKEQPGWPFSRRSGLATQRVVVVDALPPVKERLLTLERRMGALVLARSMVRVCDWQEIEVEIGVVRLVRWSGARDQTVSCPQEVLGMIEHK